MELVAQSWSHKCSGCGCYVTSGGHQGAAEAVLCQPVTIPPSTGCQHAGIMQEPEHQSPTQALKQGHLAGARTYAGRGSLALCG